jgi:hypothetical protein
MFQQTLESHIKLMHDYQQKNNIKGECIVNTQYLLDCLKDIKVAVEADAVIVIGHDLNDKSNEYVVINGHIVMRIDDDIMEPSYEIARLKNRQYFGNYQTYRAFIDKHKIEELIDTEETKAMYLKFNEIAQRINAGKFERLDDSYYDAQASYVDKRMIELGIL